jgi:hypothetical protein
MFNAIYDTRHMGSTCVALLSHAPNCFGNIRVDHQSASPPVATWSLKSEVVK